MSVTLTAFCFFVLWLSHKCKCPLGIFQLYSWHQHQPVWDLFSHLRKTTIHSRLEFRTDRTAFYKCHCHRWGWAASGHSSHVWRKVRVNDDRDWQGGLWGWARPPWTTPVSTRDPSGSSFHYLLFSRSPSSLRRLSASRPLATSEFFWQLLEPGIIFSEICLASFRDLSFRPRHNYSCFGSILATVTVLFLGCSWRLFCPSQWKRNVPITSGPWLQEGCPPWGQELKGIFLETHSEPSALVNKHVGKDDTKEESVPRSPTVCLWNTLQGTLGYTRGHMSIQSQGLKWASCLWTVQGLHPLPLHCDGKYLLTLPFFFSFFLSLAFCFYSVAGLPALYILSYFRHDLTSWPISQ